MYYSTALNDEPKHLRSKYRERMQMMHVKLSAQRNETETKRFQNSFETVLKLFCFSQNKTLRPLVSFRCADSFTYSRFCHTSRCWLVPSKKSSVVNANLGFLRSSANGHGNTKLQNYSALSDTLVWPKICYHWQVLIRSNAVYWFGSGLICRGHSE